MTIVVGYSPQPHGEAALRAAADHALETGQDVVVVNTTQGDAYADPRYARKQDLQRVVRVLSEAGISHEIKQSVVAEGAAKAILAEAEAPAVSLIVIGVRRRTPVGKLIMGSAAQTVILEADVPVLCVKAPQG